MEQKDGRMVGRCYWKGYSYWFEKTVIDGYGKMKQCREGKPKP